MKTFAMVALAGVIGLAATPAVGATLLYIPGQNYAEKVHNAGQAPGDPVTLVSQPGNYDVRYTADGVITPNGNGFAQQNGPFGWIEINPLLVDVTKIGVTLTPDRDIRFNTSFDVLVTFVGGGTQLLSGLLPSHGKIDIWAEGNELIDSIRIQNLMGSAKQNNPVAAGVLADVRHTSFDVASAIPEPGTWAMMIAGFGLVGAVVRRRGSRAAVAA